MRTFISKLRRGTKTESALGLQEAPQESPQQRLYRYRKQRGVNLGKLKMNYPTQKPRSELSVLRIVVRFRAVGIRIPISRRRRQRAK